MIPCLPPYFIMEETKQKQGNSNCKPEEVYLDPINIIFHQLPTYIFLQHPNAQTIEVMITAKFLVFTFLYLVLLLRLKVPGTVMFIFPPIWRLEKGLPENPPHLPQFMLMTNLVSPLSPILPQERQIFITMYKGVKIMDTK